MIDIQNEEAFVKAVERGARALESIADSLAKMANPVRTVDAVGDHREIDVTTLADPPGRRVFLREYYTDDERLTVDAERFARQLAETERVHKRDSPERKAFMRGEHLPDPPPVPPARENKT